MKKIAFSLLFALAATSFVFSQNLEIIEPGNSHILNDSTIYSYGLSSDAEFGPTLDIINTSSGSLTVNVRRVIIDTVTGSQNEICWALFCYGPSVNQSPNTENIGSHDTAKGSNQFNGDYLPNGHTGTTTIKYIFFNVSNHNDSAVITVVYDATATGIASLTNGEINFSALYPNPANNNVSFNYSLTNGVQTATLKIFNLLGNCVQTLPLSGLKNKTVINVQSIPTGIYLCEIEANGCQPVYQKLVVSH